LFKQDNDGVIARVDLSGMDEVVRVLSARADTVRILDQIIEEVGDDPDNWLELYYQRTGKKHD
jgi:type IV secretion system protein VirB4